jgi:hypothetical protein
MPIKSGTLQFLQDANKETIASILTNLIPNPDVNTIYILSGCKNSTVAPIHTLSAGVLYYNGEVFNFDGTTFTLTGLQKSYARIETTQYLTNADPVQFTDGVSRNVHNIRKIVIEPTITSSGLPEFKDFVLINNWLKGDTKEVVCDSTYLSTYFDSTGLGRLERLGWAIMNGNNGTPNDNGKVVISYGSSYTTLEAVAGSATTTLDVNNLPSREIRDVVAGTTFNADIVRTAGGVSSSTAGATPINIMQPYVVRLRIMKI